MVEQTINHQRQSWNPLFCGNSSLPGNAVLMLKLIVVGLLMKDYLHDLSDHFIPFWPIFLKMGSPEAFKKVLQVFFIVGSMGVLFNRWLRASCFILGMVFLISDLSSMPNYTNVHFFCACIFLLSSLSNAREPLILLRYQMAVVYLGSWMNKIFEADWRSGQYFEHWMSDIIKRDVYVKATSWFPPMVLSKLMCWSTILTEMFLMAGFILRPLKQLTILVGVYFHSIAFLLAWYDFRVFTIAILSSYLILVRWPETLTVWYNDRISVHRLGRKFFELLDWEKRIKWEAGYDGWKLSVLEGHFSGFLALKRLVLYTPSFYFLYVAVLGLPNDPFLWLKLKTVQLTLVLFFPWPEIVEYRKTKGKVSREQYA